MHDFSIHSFSSTENKKQNCPSLLADLKELEISIVNTWWSELWGVFFWQYSKRSPWTKILHLFQTVLPLPHHPSHSALFWWPSVGVMAFKVLAGRTQHARSMGGKHKRSSSQFKTQESCFTAGQQMLSKTHTSHSSLWSNCVLMSAAWWRHFHQVHAKLSI